MATRFYLGNGVAADVSPSFDSGWTVTTGADRKKLLTAKDSSAMTSKTTAATGASAPPNRFILNRQYVSDCIASQDFQNNPCRIQVRSNISSTASSSVGFICYTVYIMKPDGTQRFITENKTGGGTSFTTTLTNRGIAGSGLGASIFCNDGDRIVIEVGWFYSSGTNTTRTATQSFGADNGTDLPQDQTTTAANNPWVEFTNDILFLSPNKINQVNASIKRSNNY